MKTGPFKWHWFLYWLWHGRGHPEHVQWWIDEFAREDNARQAPRK